MQTVDFYVSKYKRNIPFSVLLIKLVYLNPHRLANGNNVVVGA
ncbi:hypothetical protein HMPREF9069_01085 [Atopobium sp. oral taxon 810 str. F0209]|nr:hypothetical protein HMPREF9069_01085 [Atopobium sp. oral taxon 810 str. F0209]